MHLTNNELYQGAGKGTQSGRIQNNFEVSTISSGDLLRKNIAQGTDIGKRAAKEMKNGAFVSDEVIVKLIDSELGKLGAEQGWLLDGFPRTMTQAQTLDHTLDSLNQPLNLVIHLNVPEEVILQRIMGKFAEVDGDVVVVVVEEKDMKEEKRTNKKNRRN